MTDTPPEHPRPFAFALTAMFFLLLAPTFWLNTERPHNPDGPHGANEALYTRTLPMLQAAHACGSATAPAREEARCIAFQPLNLVFRLVRPVERAMAWHAALCLAVAGVGLAQFLRALGARSAAALFGAVAYAFGGVAAGAMSRVELAAVLAWAPWVFWAAAWCARGPRHTRGAVAAGLFAALLLLSGAHKQAVPVLLLAACFSLAARTGRDGGIPFARRALLLGLAAAIGGGLSALSWAPALAGSGAGDVPGLAAVHPASLFSLAAHWTAARANDLPHAGYLGIAPLLLIPWAFAARGAWRHTLLFGAALPVCWAGALYFTPADGWLLAAALSGAVLAGLGADTLFAPARDWRSPRVWLPALAMSTLCLAILVWGDAAAAGRLPFAMLPAGFALAVRRPRASMVALLLLAAFTVADLAAANRNRFPHPYFDHARAASVTSEPQPLGATSLGAPTSSSALYQPMPAGTPAFPELALDQSQASAASQSPAFTGF